MERAGPNYQPEKKAKQPSVFARCLGKEQAEALLGVDSEAWKHRPDRDISSACSSSASFDSTVALLEKKQKQYLGKSYKMDPPGSMREMNLLMTKLDVSEITKEKKSQTDTSEESLSSKVSLRAFFSQLLAALAISLASMVVGFSSAYTSPALASMNQPNSTLQVTVQEQSWIGSLLPLFALIGGVVGGPMIEILGRRITIAITSIPFVTSFLFIAFANTVKLVMVGRALAGFSVGIGSLAFPIYLGETLQPELRGSLGLLPTLLGNGGILICFIAGKYLDWSQLALLGAVLPICFLVLMFFIPETPRWYINKNNAKKAQMSLVKLRGENTDISKELAELLNNTNSSEKGSITFSEIFTKRNMCPVIISIGLMFFQQMSGINAVIFYTVQIFEDAGSTIDSNTCTIIVGLVNCGSTFVATALIDRLGRKILLNISSVSMIITLSSLGTFFYLKDSGADVSCYGWLPLASFVIFVIGFSIGFGPIPWLMMGEILPAKIRGSAASVITAFNWTCTFIVTKTFSDLTSLMGSHGAFGLFGVMCLIGLVFINVLVPETRGKSLEEIELYFSRTTKEEQVVMPSRENSETDFKPITINV